MTARTPPRRDLLAERRSPPTSPLRRPLAALDRGGVRAMGALFVGLAWVFVYVIVVVLWPLTGLLLLGAAVAVCLLLSLPFFLWDLLRDKLPRLLLGLATPAAARTWTRLTP